MNAWCSPFTLFFTITLSVAAVIPNDYPTLNPRQLNAKVRMATTTTDNRASSTRSNPQSGKPQGETPGRLSAAHKKPGQADSMPLTKANGSEAGQSKRRSCQKSKTPGLTKRCLTDDELQTVAGLVLHKQKTRVDQANDQWREATARRLRSQQTGNILGIFPSLADSPYQLFGQDLNRVPEEAYRQQYREEAKAAIHLYEQKQVSRNMLLAGVRPVEGVGYGRATNPSGNHFTQDEIDKAVKKG